MAARGVETLRWKRRPLNGAKPSGTWAFSPIQGALFIERSIYRRRPTSKLCVQVLPC